MIFIVSFSSLCSFSSRLKITSVLGIKDPESSPKSFQFISKLNKEHPRSRNVGDSIELALIATMENVVPKFPQHIVFRDEEPSNARIGICGGFWRAMLTTDTRFVNLNIALFEVPHLFRNSQK